MEFNASEDIQVVMSPNPNVTGVGKSQMDVSPIVTRKAHLGHEETKESEYLIMRKELEETKMMLGQLVAQLGVQPGKIPVPGVEDEERFVNRMVFGNSRRRDDFGSVSAGKMYEDFKRRHPDNIENVFNSAKPVFERDDEPGEYPSLQELKLVKIEPFDGSEVYPGLGSNFYDWGKRFVRMINMAQATSRKIWKESVKIERLSHCLNGKALSLFNARVDAWYAESPTLEHVLVKLNSRFTVVLQPAQMLSKFTQAKGHKTTWSEHLMYLIAVNNTAGGGYERLILQNIVDYASPSLCYV